MASPGCSLSFLHPPRYFLTPWRQLELGARLPFPGDALPSHRSSLGTLGPSPRTPRERRPARVPAGVPPPESRTRVLTCVPTEGSPAKLERRRRERRGGGRHDGGRQRSAAPPRPVAGWAPGGPAAGRAAAGGSGGSAEPRPVRGAAARGRRERLRPDPLHLRRAALDRRRCDQRLEGWPRGAAPLLPT